MAEQGRTWNARDPERPVRQIRPGANRPVRRIEVAEEAEQNVLRREGHDHEIVAAEAPRRDGDGEAGHESDRDGYYHDQEPSRRQTYAQQSIDIRAEGEIAGVRHRQQAAVSDEHVHAQSEDGENGEE